MLIDVIIQFTYIQEHVTIMPTQGHIQVHSTQQGDYINIVVKNVQTHSFFLNRCCPTDNS